MVDGDEEDRPRGSNRRRLNSREISSSEPDSSRAGTTPREGDAAERLRVIEKEMEGLKIQLRVHKKLEDTYLGENSTLVSEKLAIEAGRLADAQGFQTRLENQASRYELSYQNLKGRGQSNKHCVLKSDDRVQTETATLTAKVESLTQQYSELEATLNSITLATGHSGEALIQELASFGQEKERLARERKAMEELNEATSNQAHREKTLQMDERWKELRLREQSLSLAERTLDAQEKSIRQREDVSEERASVLRSIAKDGFEVCDKFWWQDIQQREGAILEAREAMAKMEAALAQSEAAVKKREDAVNQSQTVSTTTGLSVAAKVDCDVQDVTDREMVETPYKKLEERKTTANQSEQVSRTTQPSI
ncbi:hypothetical protein K523DRAFT_357745 [Schizophyllum commune Tattone D]|nr:hypothetical protein K523DRAFT_357745 [Schizophyllum commune Tattone D]